MPVDGTHSFAPMGRTQLNPLVKDTTKNTLFSLSPVQPRRSLRITTAGHPQTPKQPAPEHSSTASQKPDSASCSSGNHQSTNVPVGNAPPQIQRQERNIYCHICLSTAALLGCSFCPRSVCTTCISLPGETPSKLSWFLCLVCHVETFGSSEPNPYHGFYTSARRQINSSALDPSSLKPLFPQPLQIDGTLQMTFPSQVSNKSMAIFHFIHLGLKKEGSPAGLVASYMRAWLEDGKVLFFEIQYDSSNFKQAALLASKSTELAMSSMLPFDRVVIFVTDCPLDEARNFSAPVQFFNDLFPPAFATFLATKDVSLWILSGAGLTNNTGCHKDLVTVALRYNISTTVAFTDKLKPSLAAPFILGYAQRAWIEEFSCDTCLRQLLPSDEFIVRHTDILLFSREVGSVIKGRQFIWTHPELKPWGSQLPIQCPQCLAIHPWAPGQSGSTLLFYCKNTKCSQKLEFPKPKHTTFLSAHVFRGRWLVVELD